jgi:hypothetical protein
MNEQMDKLTVLITKVLEGQEQITARVPKGVEIVQVVCSGPHLLGCETRESKTALTHHIPSWTEPPASKTPSVSRRKVPPQPHILLVEPLDTLWRRAGCQSSFGRRYANPTASKAAYMNRHGRRARRRMRFVRLARERGLSWAMKQRAIQNVLRQVQRAPWGNRHGRRLYKDCRRYGRFLALVRERGAAWSRKHVTVIGRLLRRINQAPFQTAWASE